MSLTIICPNLQRYNIKVGPGTLLYKAVEEACLKSGYDVNAVKALNHRRPVDLSLSYRLSGLPNNATIELEENEKGSNASNVDIALQLPTGDRPTLSVPANLALVDVLKEFEASTGRSLLEEYDSQFGPGHPGVVIMNKQYVGPELNEHTLMALGLKTGRHLVRYVRSEISPEKLAAINERLSEEARRRAELSATYERAKEKNEQDKRLEQEREQRFAEEVKEIAKQREEEMEQLRQQWMKEEEEKAAAAAAAEQERMEIAEAASAPQFSFAFPPINSSSTQPQQSTSPARSDDRLARLNALLQMVDRAPVTEVLAESGPVSLSQLANAAEAMDMSESPGQPGVPDPCNRQMLIFERPAADPSTSQSMDQNDVPDEFYEIGVDDLKAMQKDLSNQVNMQVSRSFIPRSFIEKKNKERKLEAYPHTVLRISVGKTRLIQANFLSNEPVSRVFDLMASVLPPKTKFSLSLVLNQPLCNSAKTLIDEDLSPKCVLVLKNGQNFEEGLSTNSTFSEAEQLSRDWLSCNTKFVPFTSTVNEPPPALGPAKRTAADDAQIHRTGSKSNSGPTPKWIKFK